MSQQRGISRVNRSKEAARIAYNRLSRWYDLLAGGSEERFLRIGLHKLNVCPGERALDIGCGTGRGVLALAERVGAEGRVYGLDLSEGMLRVAQARVDRAGLSAHVELRQGDAAALPFADGSLDATIMSFTLELFDTPELPFVLAECRRVLEDGGRICVVAMAVSARPGLMYKLYERAHERFPRYVDCRPIYAKDSLHRSALPSLRCRKA